MSRRRYVQTVTPPDDVVTGGRPKLWAYGQGFIGLLAGVAPRSVRRAVAAGKLDPTSPVSVIAYALRKRGHGDLAARVTETLTRSRPADGDQDHG